MAQSYRALRGGNYRRGGDAVAGEVYDDIPEELVDDLIARRAIEPAPTPERGRSGASRRGQDQSEQSEVKSDA